MVALDHDQVYQMIVNSSYAQAIIFHNLPFFFKISAASHMPYELFGMVSSLSIKRILKWQHYILVTHGLRLDCCQVQKPLQCAEVFYFLHTMSSSKILAIGGAI